MAYRCGQCGNEEDFYLVWEDVTVKKEADNDGGSFGPAEVDEFLDDDYAEVECAVCGVQHLVEEYDPYEEEDGEA